MAHEFVIKNGFISKGDSIVSGSLSGETLNLTTTPSNDNSQTQVLVRNNTTGLVEYRDASTFSGASDTNTFVTGFTYNENNTFTINDNVGSAFTATINQLSGLTVNGTLSATTLDGNTILSGGTNLLTIIESLDTYVTGGTYSDITDVITFTNTNGVPFNVTGVTDTFVTGFTWNPSTFDLTIEQNNGITDETVNLSILSSDVYVLSGVYSASTGVVTYTNSTGGTFQVSGFTTGMTDSYTVSANLNSESIEFVNNLQTPSPFYSVSLTPLLSGKTNNTTFNAYTSDTQTTLNTKISGATNLSTTGIFGQKNGQNLEFKGITSTGGTVTITNDSTSLNLDVTIPVDTNTFVTGGTYNPSTVNLDFSGNSGFSAFTVDVSALKDDTNTFVTGFTYNDANTFTINDNAGSAFTATINQVSGLTVNGILSATTISGGTLYGDGSNLTGILTQINTGNVLWVDNIFGNDGTALVDRQDKPWSSIATALSNATTNDTIMVRPGDYVEPPFTLIPGTSLISQGGPKVTFISGSTTTGNFITVSGSSYMEGFTLYTPTDDSAALYFNDPTGDIVTSFHNVHFKGSSVSGGTGVTLGKGLVMDSGLGSGPPPAKIIYTELRYGGGHLDTLVEVNKGIFTLDGIHVPGGQTVNKGIQANGGRLQLTNVNIGNGNCNTAISVSGTASNTPVVVGFGLNLFNVPTGLEITSNYYEIELQNGRFEAGVENLLISSGLTGEFGKLNMVNFIMDSEKIDEPYTWADSEHTIFYSDIGNSQNVSPIIRTHGNLEIGQPNRGSSLSVGRGTEYQKGMHLHSSGTTGTTNLTLSATTKGVIWSFESLTAGEELYIGSSERYPNGDYVNWCGFELTYTGSTGGTYTIEYYSGGTWVDIKYQVTNQEFGYNYSNNLFHRTVGTIEDVRIAVLKNNGWSESTIFGHTAKWVRITMVTPPASLPQFDLLWLDGSHTEINQNGISTYYGSALYRDTLLSAGNVFGESGGVLSASVPVGTGAPAPTGWDHSIKNSRLNGNGDAIYLQSALPRGLCSAYPLRVKIYFGLDPGDGVAITSSPELITSFLAKGASGTLVADPSGGITPLPRTIENTTTFTSSPGSFVTSDLVEVGKPTNTYADKAMSIQDIEFDISESYEGDGFLLRIELNDDGTPNQDVIIFAVEVDVVKWALGERVQVE